MAHPNEGPIRLTLPVPDDRFDQVHRISVEGGGRLVQQQDCRVELDRPEQGDDLAFAAGELMVRSEQKGFIASGSRKQSEDAVTIVRTPAVDSEGERESEVFLDSSRNERRPLMDIDHLTPKRWNSMRRDAATAPKHVTAVERIQQSQCSQ